MAKRPYVTGAHGFTCAACCSESSMSPIRIESVGLVCRLCAAFLIRAELSFDLDDGWLSAAPAVLRGQPS